MEGIIHSISDFLESVPVGPVELTLIQLNTGGAGDNIARLIAPTSILAKDLDVVPGARYGPSGKDAVVCTLNLKSARDPEDLKAILPQLAFQVRIYITVYPPGAASASPDSVVSFVRPGDENVAVGLAVPTETVPGTTFVLRSLVIAGERVPLSSNPPTIITYDGPADLTLDQAAQLQEWLGGHTRPGVWREVYRATRDGFSGVDFDKTCTGVPRLLVLARESAHGWLYGGYTEVGFLRKSDEDYYADPHAFLFSLVTPLGRPEKLEALGTGREMVRFKGYGATFGDGCDLYISGNADKNSSCGTCINGRAYARPAATGNHLMAVGQQGGWLLSEVVAFAMPPL